MDSRLLLGMASFVVLAGCSAKPDLAAERAALQRIDSAWAAAAAAGDIERTLSYWADDAVVFAPDRAPIRGKDALRAYVSESFQIPGFAIRWATTETTISPAGDMAFASGTNEVRLSGPDGKPIVLAGKVVTVWRKGADGDWKCVVDIWNAAGPPAPSGKP